MGAKEDISLASWKEINALSPMKVVREDSHLSPAVQNEGMLQMIPRKRTNADKVISPKKRERKIALIEEMVGESVKAELPDKPLRRRKSLRKSTRRSTLASLESSFGDLSALQEMAPARLPKTSFDISHAAPRISLDSNMKLEFASVPLVDGPKQAAAESPIEKPVNEESLADDISSTIICEIGAAEQSVEENIELPRSEDLPMSEFTTEQLELEPDPELTVRMSTNSASGCIPDFVQEARKLIPGDIIDQEEVSDPILNSPQERILADPSPKTLQAQAQPIPTQPATEDQPKDVTQATVKFTKSIATPRSKGRTGQHQGARRSMRTRTSSSHAEGDAVNEVTIVEAAPFRGLETSPSKLAAYHFSPVKNRNTSPPKEMLKEPTLSIIEEKACDGNAPTTESGSLPIEPIQEGSPSHKSIQDEKLEADAVVSGTFSEEQAPDQAHNDNTMAELILGENSIAVGTPKDLSEEVDSEAFDDSISDAGSTNHDLAEASCQLTFELANSLLLQSSDNENRASHSSLSSSTKEIMSQVGPDETDPQDLEALEPIFIPSPAVRSLLQSNTNDDDTFDVGKASSTPPKAPEPTQDKPSVTTYDNDETDMLRNFLSRVKADKAAKAETASFKRKRSFPHSPLHIPLGKNPLGTAYSPSSPKTKDEFDVSLPPSSPSKRRKCNAAPPSEDEEVTEPRSIRRSGRTRLPLKTANLPTPSLIPFRRLGQDGGDNTITIRRSEEKELAALTRVNTRKNKGAALCPADVLAKKGEKEDPVSRQRHLKEIFDEKASKKKSKKAKTVVWAEEIASFQTADGKEKKVKIVKKKEVKEAKVIKEDMGIIPPVENPKPAEEVEKVEAENGNEKLKQGKKSTIPRVGMKSRIARAATNGTPMRKRARS